MQGSIVVSTEWKDCTEESQEHYFPRKQFGFLNNSSYLCRV